MWVINCDTNTVIGGFPVPQGAFELPFHGSVGVLTSGGCNTNFDVSSADTIFVWVSGAAVDRGVSQWQFFVAGFGIVFASMGVVAILRWLQGGMVHIGSPREL